MKLLFVGCLYTVNDKVANTFIPNTSIKCTSAMDFLQHHTVFSTEISHLHQRMINL